MKKKLCLFLSIFILFGTISPVWGGQGNTVGTGDAENLVDRGNVTESTKWMFDNPVTILDTVNGNANKDRTQQVQYTEFDPVSSNACEEIFVDGRFTIARTLCNLKMLSKDYLQYIMYIGLTVATILIIRNGFRLVTSTDREKQMTTFTKNMKYIVVGVVLLIGFYYVINVFVSVVNLVFE